MRFIFYLPEPRRLIHPAGNLTQDARRGPGISARKNAIETVKVQSALILADAKRGPFEIHGVPVHLQPIAEWLLAE